MGQLIGFTTDRPLLTFAVFLMIAACKVLRVYINHRTIVRHETEATRRVELAVTGTASAERAAVVRACAEIEEASHSRL